MITVENKIGDFKTFPIYTFVFTWEEDGKHDLTLPSTSWIQEGLLEGRVRNSHELKTMEKEELTSQEIELKTSSHWKEYKDKHPDSSNWSNLKINTKFYRETWVLTWFTHQTFEQGLSDEEVLKSFEEYVRRYEHLQDRIFISSPLPENYKCLMGAEDRWRWRGMPEKEGDKEPKAPCRCSNCGKAGVVRISH